MRAVAILAHLMDADANLGPESLARLEAAIRLHKEEPFELFLTTGWNYRQDCPQMIGEVMAEVLKKTHHIDDSLIVADINARDTVGDAYFLRRNAVIPMNIRDLVVVTSDYHVDRAEFIFRSFCPAKVTLRVVGAKTDFYRDGTVQLHEENSLAAFQDTFAGVDFSEDRQVCNALRTRHPFYNGEVYGQLECEL